MQERRRRQCAVVVGLVLAVVTWSARAFASDQIRGVITDRGHDGTMIVQTDDASNITIALNDYTKIRRTDGKRQLKMSAAVLQPGLRVTVHGAYQSQVPRTTPTWLLAKRVTFTRADLKIAQAVRATSAQQPIRNAQNANTNTRTK